MSKRVFLVITAVVIGLLAVFLSVSGQVDILECAESGRFCVYNDNYQWIARAGGVAALLIALYAFFVLPWDSDDEDDEDEEAEEAVATE